MPTNGVKYLPEEAGKILVATSPETCQQVIDELIAQPFTDLSMQRLYAIKKRVEEGKAIKSKGRRCLASIPELKELLSGGIQGGNTVETRKITRFRVDSTSRQLEADGHSAVGVGVSAKSVRRYKDTALCLEEGRATTAALDKTEARYTAERSLMVAMMQAAVVAATGFIPTNNGVGSSSKLARAALCLWCLSPRSWCFHPTTPPFSLTWVLLPPTRCMWPARPRTARRLVFSRWTTSAT